MFDTPSPALERRIKKPSPSRTYVMECKRDDGTGGVYFRKFTLPEKIANTIDNATYYFYNNLNGFASGGDAITFEDYSDITDEPQE